MNSDLKFKLSIMRTVAIIMVIVGVSYSFNPLYILGLLISLILSGV